MKAHSATLALAMMVIMTAGCQNREAPSQAEQQNSAAPSAPAAAPQAQVGNSPTAQQDERFHHGQQLIETANCLKCHTDTSRPFGSEHSKLDSFPALKAQVEACNTNLGTGWFPEEVEAAAHYLNQKYYHFSQ